MATPRVSVRAHDSLHAKCLSGAWHGRTPRLAPDHLSVGGSLERNGAGGVPWWHRTPGSGTVGQSTPPPSALCSGTLRSSQGSDCPSLRGPHEGGQRQWSLLPASSLRACLWNGTQSTSSEGTCVLSLGVQWALHKLPCCQHSPGSDVGLASTRRSGWALSTWLPERSLGATMVPL